jgi:hypothetical protein
MVALDWDEDEDITRDMRWPPGILSQKLTQPRVRMLGPLLGPPALGFVPGAGLLGQATGGGAHQKRSRRALPLPGSTKPRSRSMTVPRPVSFFVGETDRSADQQLIDNARLTLRRATERTQRKEQSEPSIEIDLDELEAAQLDPSELDPEDLETIELAPQAVEKALESVVFALTRRASEELQPPESLASAAPTNPFLIESSSALTWPPAAFSEPSDVEPETLPAAKLTELQTAATVATGPAGAEPDSWIELTLAELPKKSPVLDLTFDGWPPSEGECPSEPVADLGPEAPSSAPALPSRPGQLVPEDDLDEAPPMMVDMSMIERLARAADGARPLAPRPPVAQAKTSVGPPPLPLRRQGNVTQAWPPPMDPAVVDAGPGPRTGDTLAGVCPEPPVWEAPLPPLDEVPPPADEIVPPPPPRSEIRAVSVVTEPQWAPREDDPPPSAPMARPVAPPAFEAPPSTYESATYEPARPVSSPHPMTRGTRDRRRDDKEEEERHRAALGYPSTMPFSWVTVPALESSPALPLIPKVTANSLAPTMLAPTMLAQLPPVPSGSWRSRTQWLAAALTLCAVALLTWQLLPRDGSLRVDLAQSTPAQSTPSVAIYLDGVKKCDATPCEIAEVHTGARVITVMAPGFERAQTTASVAPGELTQLTLSMKAIPPPPEPTVQGLRAKSAQRGVEISVDGEGRGELPIELNDLTPGRHLVRFSASDRYAAFEQEIDLGAGTVKDLGSIELTLLRGLVTIEVRTARTRVLIGNKGRRASQKDIRGPWPRKLELEPGHYDVIGAKEGFLPVAYSVTVDAAHPEPHVVIDLEPNPYAYNY